MKKFLLLIICILFISGCYDYKELKDIDIITGIGVDYEDGKYKVTLEILEATAKDNKEEQNTILIESSDEVFSKAFEGAYIKFSKQPYFSQLKLLLISEDVARDPGIQELTDFILRTSRIGNCFNVAIAKDSSAYEMFNTKQDNKTVANTIVNLLKNSSNYSILNKDNKFNILVSKILQEGMDIYLPSVEISDDKFISSNYVIFDDFKMSNYLDLEYSTIFNLLTSNASNNIYLNDGINAIDVYNSKSKIDVLKDKVNITLNIEGNIKSLEDKYSLKDKSTFHEFNKIFEKKLYSEVKELINFLKENDSDVLGIENKYYKFQHKYYYDEVENDIEYEFDINVNVNKFGILFEVIK